MTGVLDLFALANNFTFEYVPIPVGLSGASARMAECLSRIGETVRMILRVTLLQREILETKPLAERAPCNVERSPRARH